MEFSRNYVEADFHVTPGGHEDTEVSTEGRADYEVSLEEQGDTMENLEDDMTRIMTRSASYVEADFYMPPGKQADYKVSTRGQADYQVSPEEYGDTMVNGKQNKDDWLRSVEEQDDLNTWNQNSCQEDPSHRLNIAHATQPTVDCRAGGCGIGRGS